MSLRDCIGSNCHHEFEKIPFPEEDLNGEVCPDCGHPQPPLFTEREWLIRTHDYCVELEQRLEVLEGMLNP